MSGANYSILVADDDPEVVESVTLYLDELSKRFRDFIDVHKASSALDVLTILAKHRVDALFLDYHFEHGVSADEIIDRIEDPFEDILIILMSGRDLQEIDDVLVKRHLNLGSKFKFLRKPFEFIEIQDRYLEMKQFFSSRPYPFPLAYAEHSLSASSTAQAQITAMKDLVETITKYSVAVLMADIRRLDLVDMVTVDIARIPRLTLEDWLDWLSELLAIFQPHQVCAFMPELLHLFEGGEHLGLMYGFKAEVQDVEIGQGYAKEEGWYAKLTQRYLGPFRSLFSHCAFTSRYNLLRAEQVDFADDDRYEYRVRVLMGAETRFGLTSMHSHYRLNRERVYLLDPKGEYLSLHPFLLYSVCDKCSLGRLYMLDSMQPKQFVYNAFCNHRIGDRQCKSDFDAEYGKVLLRAKTQPDFGLQKGQVLANQYRILDIAGTTNHSQVVKAWDELLKREVGIKLLYFRQELSEDIAQQLHKNLLREAQILVKLRHCNVGQVYTAIKDPLGIVVQWIDGWSLQRRIDTQECMPVVEVANIGIKLASALNCIHSQGIIHRDIKPANVIAQQDGQPILIDFDIARSATLDTLARFEGRSLSYIGTPTYSAPEQFTSPFLVGPAADMFALGTMLYQLLTGQMPYPWGNDLNLYDGHQFPLVEQCEIPDGLYKIICRLLDSNPNDRLDAEKLSAELRIFLAGFQTGQ